jgi:hypothetical protein
MTLKDQINTDIKNAMRARETKKLSALRLISAAIKQIEVDERIELDDERVNAVLNKLVKQRHESIAQFKTANRIDLIAQEEFELQLISHYLPEPLSEADVTTIIDQVMSDIGAANISHMGQIMASLKTKLQGRADMSRVSALIKARLS